MTKFFVMWPGKVLTEGAYKLVENIYKKENSNIIKDWSYDSYLSSIHIEKIENGYIYYKLGKEYYFETIEALNKSTLFEFIEFIEPLTTAAASTKEGHNICCPFNSTKVNPFTDFTATTSEELEIFLEEHADAKLGKFVDNNDLIESYESVVVFLQDLIYLVNNEN